MSSSELWDSCGGPKAAFGEDPAKIDPMGHEWEHLFFDMGFCGWGPDKSMQRCAACGETREVLMHPGPGGGNRYAGSCGSPGYHGFDFDKHATKHRCPCGKKVTP